MLTWTGLRWEKKTEDWIDPVKGVITSSCGTRENPILHKEELHEGLDIAVAEGTDVLAVKSGVVTEVRTSATYGKVLKYETEDGYTIMYAHLSEVLVKKGNTGLSTGPHLHYGVYKDGELLDPMDFISLGWTEGVRAEYKARGEVL